METEKMLLDVAYSDALWESIINNIKEIFEAEYLLLVYSIEGIGKPPGSPLYINPNLY